MTLSDVSIQRPILTWMMTLALIVFGVLGFLRLGVDQFPNMEFPVLTVQAVLEGATPEGMEEDVTDVLEEHLNTIGGVRSIRSTSYQGVALIVVEFELGTRPRHRRPGRARQGGARACRAAGRARAAGGREPSTRTTRRCCGSRSTAIARSSTPASTCAAR